MSCDDDSDYMVPIQFATFISPLQSRHTGIASTAWDKFPKLMIPDGFRISIEESATHPGEYNWTFIPKATLLGGGEDEGANDEWPRMVTVFGTTQLLTRDQWDMYKCDPTYICRVPAKPGPPCVVRAEGAPAPASSPPPNSTKKRALSETIESEAELAAGLTCGATGSKRRRVEIVDEVDSGDETETKPPKIFSNPATKERARAQAQRTRQESPAMYANIFPKKEESPPPVISPMSTEDLSPPVVEVPPPQPSTSKQDKRLPMKTDPVTGKRARDEEDDQNAPPTTSLDDIHRSPHAPRRTRVDEPLNPYAESLRAKDYGRVKASRFMEKTYRKAGVPFDVKTRGEKSFREGVNLSELAGQSFAVDEDTPPSTSAKPEVPKSRASTFTPTTASVPPATPMTGFSSIQKSAKRPTPAEYVRASSATAQFGEDDEDDDHSSEPDVLSEAEEADVSRLSESIRKMREIAEQEKARAEQEAAKKRKTEAEAKRKADAEAQQKADELKAARLLAEREKYMCSHVHQTHQKFWSWSTESDEEKARKFAEATGGRTYGSTYDPMDASSTASAAGSAGSASATKAQSGRAGPSTSKPTTKPAGATPTPTPTPTVNPTPNPPKTYPTGFSPSGYTFASSP